MLFNLWAVPGWVMLGPVCQEIACPCQGNLPRPCLLHPETPRARCRQPGHLQPGNVTPWRAQTTGTSSASPWEPQNLQLQTLAPAAQPCLQPGSLCCVGVQGDTCLCWLKHPVILVLWVLKGEKIWPRWWKSSSTGKAAWGLEHSSAVGHCPVID